MNLFVKAVKHRTVCCITSHVLVLVDSVSLCFKAKHDSVCDKLYVTFTAISVLR